MNTNLGQLTTQEQQILTEYDFYDDLALRKLIVEIKQEKGVEPGEVFEALSFAFQNGLDLKKYLQGLRESVRM